MHTLFTKEKSRKGYLQKMAQSQPLPTAPAASQVPLICDRLANLSVAMDMDTQIPALHSPPAPVQPPQAVTQASPVTVLSQPPIAQPPPLIPAQPPMQIQPPVQTPASQPPTFTASDWTYHTSQFEGSSPFKQHQNATPPPAQPAQPQMTPVLGIANPFATSSWGTTTAASQPTPPSAMTSPCAHPMPQGPVFALPQPTAMRPPPFVRPVVQAQPLDRELPAWPAQAPRAAASDQAPTPAPAFSFTQSLANHQQRTGSAPGW